MLYISKVANQLPSNETLPFFAVPKAVKAFLHAFLKRYNRQIVPIRSPFADMRRFIDPNQGVGIVDGGAHYGEISIEFLKIFPNATIYAFEPETNAFNRLRERARSYKAIHPIKNALGSTCRSMELYVNRFDVTSSLLPRSELGEKYTSWKTELDHVEMVHLTTLDHWWSEMGNPAIEILKLDLQGWELEALKGAAYLLKSSILAVFIEISFAALYQNSCAYYQIGALLGEYGFELYQLYHLRTDQDGRLLYADALFCKSELMPS